MRLFGVPGGSLDQARSTYWVMPPFDLALAQQVVTPVVPPVGWDMQTYDVQQNPFNPGIPNWSVARRPVIVGPRGEHLEGNLSAFAQLQGVISPYPSMVSLPDGTMTPGDYGEQSAPQGVPEIGAVYQVLAGSMTLAQNRLTGEIT